MELRELYNIYCNTIYNQLKDRLNAHIFVGIRNDKLGIHIEEGNIGLIFTMDNVTEKIICGDYPTKKVVSMMMRNWQQAIYGWYFKSADKAV